MTYQDVLAQAREKMSPKCKVCKDCNGIACRGETPGPSGKGSARSFIRNYSYLADRVRIHMDALAAEEGEKDCSITLFGKKFSAPIFCSPIGMIEFNYSPALDEGSYAEAVISGTKAAGTAAFTGGGLFDKCFFDPLAVINAEGGWGIPTLKPWALDIIEERLPYVEDSKAFAFAMDIDSAGLAHASLSKFKMVAKSESDLKSIVSLTKLPFIVKGIMTPESAIKAANAGAYAIVISNHGGRVLDYGLSTAEILPAIKKAVGNSVKIFIDGGIRSGTDVFKVLALGADAAMIGRPYAVAAFGGGAEGVTLYTEKLIQELKETMTMTSCKVLADITEKKISII